MDSPDFLRDFVVLFSLAVIVVVLCHRIRLPAIIGFLITGVIAGPHGLGLIHEEKSVETMAEIGVVLLLFTVGIEFSLERLYRIRSIIIFGGGFQVVVTLSLTAAAGASFFGMTPAQSIFLGMLVALSSTAGVLKLLSERAELDSPQGRIAVGILIFQDLCVVPMVIVAPFLAGEGPKDSSVFWTIALAVIMVSAAMLAGRFAFPWILGQVVKTRNRQAFLLVTIMLCLGTAWLSALAGLSLALGAFLAGLIVSQSEYSHQALGEMVPFRDAFSSLFFISIGMLLNVGTFADPLPVFGAVAALVLVKTVVTAGAALVIGYGFRVAIVAGLTLAQIGEFSFVLAERVRGTALLDDQLYQYFLAAAVVTMTLTPLWTAIAPRVASGLERFVPGERLRRGRAALPEEVSSQLEDHVIILGYGPTGRTLAQVLKRVSMPWVAVEMNPETVTAERQKGEPVFYGDATKVEVLEHAGIKKARVLVITVNDAASVRQATHLARRNHPGLHIIVRTRYLSELGPLLELGANEVVPEELETSLEIFSRTLRQLLVPRDVVDRIVRETRLNGYGVLREEDAQEQSTERVDRLLRGVELEVFRVAPGSALVGSTLRDTDLRHQTGASVLAIEQDGEFLVNPAASTQLNEGMTAIVFGDPEQISKAAQLFQATATVEES